MKHNFNEWFALREMDMPSEDQALQDYIDNKTKMTGVAPTPEEVEQMRQHISQEYRKFQQDFVARQKFVNSSKPPSAFRSKNYGQGIPLP